MKHTKTLAMLLSLALAAGFTSCDSDDLRGTLSQPNVEQTAASYQSLSFSWEKIDGAVQYGYRLVDPNGRAVTSDVTHKTSVRISGLQPSTTYTLQVWAFAAPDGNWSTPPAIELSATTDDLVKLAAPVVSDAFFKGVLTFTWQPVENANEYSYLIAVTSGAAVISGTTTRTSVSLSGYPDGEYTISVVALGHDGYSSSEAATATATITGNDADPMSAITGTFTNHFVGGSSLNSGNWTWEEIDAPDWTATIKKVDEETVEIDGLFWTGCPVYGVVDFEAGTIFIEAQEYGEWYTFGSGTGHQDPVTATINADGSITIPNFAMWYPFDDVWQYYTLGTSTLTK